MIEEILVFDSYEDAYYQLINHFLSNNRTSNLISEIIVSGLDRYTETPEYKKKVREIEKREGKKISPVIAKRLTELIGQEYEQICANAGQGLELRCTFNLFANNKNCYRFTEGHMTFYDCDVGDHTHLVALIESVKKEMQRISFAFGGANVKPIFYSVRQDLSLLSEEEKSDIKEKLMKIGLKGKGRVYHLLSDLSYDAERGGVRNLNQQEREKFEKLYFGK